jgi:hypothetical protein
VEVALGPVREGPVVGELGAEARIVAGEGFVGRGREVRGEAFDLLVS